jgi:two-component system alkaline phosphatase synthesis response regulator PhoP
MENNNKVLIVEDDVFLGGLLLERFKKEGINVELTTSAESALENILRNPPELVLLDVLLPKMNGIDMMKKLQETNILPTLPILILSNFSQKDKMKEGLDLGAREYLIKANIDLDEIVKKVKAILAVV